MAGIDWNDWQPTQIVTLLQFLMLSCGEEPPSDEDQDDPFFDRENMPDTASKEALRRARSARANLGRDKDRPRGLPVIHWFAAPYELQCTMELRASAAWAKEQGWQLPGPMEQMARDEAARRAREDEEDKQASDEAPHRDEQAQAESTAAEKLKGNGASNETKTKAERNRESKDVMANSITRFTKRLLADPLDRTKTQADRLSELEKENKELGLPPLTPNQLRTVWKKAIGEIKKKNRKRAKVLTDAGRRHLTA